MATLRTRVYAVKLMLLDHGEIVKCMGLDEDLRCRGVEKGEKLDEEIKRQSAILEEYERLYGGVRGP